MIAALDDVAVVEHQDLVGIDDRRQAMGDDQGGAVGGDLGEARLDLALGLGVERRGRLVEDQDFGAFRMTRAIATRCFSPPDSFSPRSPTVVS